MKSIAGTGVKCTRISMSVPTTTASVTRESRKPFPQPLPKRPRPAISVSGSSDVSRELNEAHIHGDNLRGGGALFTFTLPA